MVTVIIPGYSLHNKEWLEETAQKIDVEGEIRTIYWDHWSESGKEFNPKEKARIINDIAGLRMVNIIAKSIGTLVAAYMIQESPEKIRKVIINGIPLNDISEEDKEVVKSALKLVPPEDIVCYQNEEDPHGDFDQAKNFLSKVDPKVVVITKPRSDHEYFYQDEYRKFLLG